MSLPIIILPEARLDLLAAKRWYEGQRDGLGVRFLRAFEDLLARIEAFPELYAVYRNEFRCGKLRRFPYLVFYRVLEERIEVGAVIDARRDPEDWENRL